MNLYGQLVGLFGQGIGPMQGVYLHTGQHNTEKMHTHIIHALSGIQTHDPSVQGTKDSTCLRLLSHWD